MKSIYNLTLLSYQGLVEIHKYFVNMFGCTGDHITTSLNGICCADDDVTKTLNDVYMTPKVDVKKQCALLMTD